MDGFYKPEDGGRSRINFRAIESACPELADRVRLVRSRAKDLESKFASDARWALDRFSVLTYVGMAIAILVILGGIWMASRADGSLSVTAGLLIGTLTASVAAGVQAFGFHKRFGAFCAARWAMTALVTRIDQQVLQFAIAARKAGDLDDEAQKRVEDEVAVWVAQIGEIMSVFGRTYGTAIEPLSLKALPPLTK